MSSELNGHSPRNRARRHFLGVAAAAAARVAILGALVSSSLPARAWATNGGTMGGTVRVAC
ncbi:hypothetical protein [Brucella inopinata]|uniref:hypothetical protein n=1 Tax=Brucella inopinata TaxID=1218315 RepID=UPI000B1E0ADF